MFSKVDHHVSEYLCRWNIPGWENLKHCFVDAVYSDRFVCSCVSSGVKQSFLIWFPDGSARKHPDQTTLRWIKILNRALKLGSKVVLLGEMLACGSVTDSGCAQLRLTTRNAIMMSGQCSMSGDQVRIFEYCCGGFKGWTGAMDILTKHEQLNLQSLGGVDTDPTCVDMCTKHEHDRGHGTSVSELTSFDELGDPKWFVGDLNLMQTWETISIRSFDLVCISAPCQSFTTTGNNQGWEHALGVVLAKAIACAAMLMQQVTGIRGTFENMLDSKLDSTSKRMMSDLKDMMLTLSVAAQPTIQPGRTKDRARAGRSRSPKDD